MQCMAPSQAPPAAAPCVPVGSLWVLPLAPFCHPFGSFWHLFEPFGFFRFSLLPSLTNTRQTPCQMGRRWRQSTWWHGRLCPLTFRHLGSFLGRWCFRRSFCLPETMKSQDVSDYEDANCELSMQPIRTGLCVAVWHVLCGCSVAWNWNPWRRITEDYHRRLFTTQNVFRFPILMYYLGLLTSWCNSIIKQAIADPKWWKMSSDTIKQPSTAEPRR